MTIEHYPTYRAVLLEERLAAYKIDIEEKDAVINILSDLRHLCDRYGFDFAELDDIAHRNYLEEIDEEGTAATK